MADMTPEAFRTMLDRLRAFSVTTLDIIGGEPTIHPGILRFISEANNRGLRVNLSSNGTDSKLLEEIMKTCDRVAVGVSINDRETLDRLKEFIEKKHHVVKTVYKRPVDYALIADILSLKPKKLYLIYRDAITPEELDETVPFPQYMNDTAARFNPQEVGMVYCSGFTPDAAYPELSKVRCPAGTTKLGVMPDGSVYPCNLFFGRAGFLLGNILVDSFETIWNHRVLAFFRTYTENNCPQSSCELHPRCHGGCPAQAFNLAGDLSAPDPRCSGKTACG
jgi:radical SAM protein with 4Fe4S-binding SPASM domain